jgi:hypothetical protein
LKRDLKSDLSALDESAPGIELSDCLDPDRVARISENPLSFIIYSI